MAEIEDGYVKLSRKVFNSKTFSHLNAIQKLIAIYLILMANHKDKQWWDKYHNKFITIKEGSFITSTEQIRKKINDRLVTTQKIRTCVKILENMQFLTNEITSGYSHITIIKYSFYQDASKYKTKGLTSHQQASNKPLTTNNNGKNGKNDKKRDILSGKPDLEAPIKYLNQKTKRGYDPKSEANKNLVRARYNEGRSLDDFKKVIDKKCRDWLTDGKMVKYLTPSTLFSRTNFENYINEPEPDPYKEYYGKE